MMDFDSDVESCSFTLIDVQTLLVTKDGPCTLWQTVHSGRCPEQIIVPCSLVGLRCSAAMGCNRDITVDGSAVLGRCVYGSVLHQWTYPGRSFRLPAGEV